ncbi:co-chaperone GroES [bacterium]|nr:MAG: co-chaperone GroES [bacterium]
MKIKPLGDRVLVRPLASEDVTKSGIVLPSSAEKEQKEQGEIVALGNGVKLKKLHLKVGQTVVFGKYSGDELEMDRTDGRAGKVQYKFLKEEDILGIVDN